MMSWRQMSPVDIFLVFIVGALVVLITAAALMGVMPEGRQHWGVAFGCALGVGLVVCLATFRHVQAQLARQRGELESLAALAERLEKLEVVRPADCTNYANTRDSRARLLRWMGEAADHLGLIRQVTEGVYGVEALFDTDLKLVWISPSIERLTGYSPQECLQRQDVIAFLVDESDRRYCTEMAMRVRESAMQQDFEMRFRVKTGGVGWVACHWRPMLDEHGGVIGLRMSAEDIQVRKRTEHQLLETVAELRRAQALQEHYLIRSNDERLRLTALLNVIRLAILFVDHEKRVLYFNRAMLEMWGFSSEENLMGMRDVVLLSALLPMLKNSLKVREYIRAVIAKKIDGSKPYEIEFKDGRIVTVVFALVDKGLEERSSRVWIFEDVTEQRSNAARLIELAERDPLTNLYNRRRFHEELDRLLAEAERHDTVIGLIAMDLDGFKLVNDELGHQIGDAVLVGLADHVGSMIRRNEMFFRLGGDEFAILVPDTDQAELSELASRLVTSIDHLDFVFDGRRAHVTASLGIAMIPLNAHDGNALIAAADEAMYCSKSTGRNQWKVSTRISQGEIKPVTDV